MIKKLILAAMALTLYVPAADAQTCGVREPWATNHFDGYFSGKLPCTGEFIDDVWTRFELDQDEWEQFGVSEGGCNYNMPLGRTISALELMAFAGTDFPHCDSLNDLVLNWAFCFAGNAIHELTPVCDHPTNAATTFHEIQLDYRTELHKPFFYDFDVPLRAATIFHEARHADGECVHTGGCLAGGEACDPSFNDGCVGILSSDKKGAYAWSVIWLQRYLANLQPHLFDQTIAERVQGQANAVLGRNFEVDPCFRVGDVAGTLTMGLDENGLPISGC